MRGSNVAVAVVVVVLLLLLLLVLVVIFAVVVAISQIVGDIDVSGRPLESLYMHALDRITILRK